MKTTLPRSFYMPRVPTTPVDCAGTNLEIHTYEMGGVPYAIGFSGTVPKPLFHTRYMKAESRATQIQGYIANAKDIAKEKADRAAARKALVHTLKVGDVLCGSWGYDQTQISAYEVVRVVSGKSVEIREIGTRYAGESNAVPVPGSFTGPVMLKRVGNGNHISIESYLSISPWDGTPQYQTPLNAGH